MELKFIRVIEFKVVIKSSNRTFMELKYRGCAFFFKDGIKF